jgi:hypothetical protein
LRVSAERKRFRSHFPHGGEGILRLGTPERQAMLNVPQNLSTTAPHKLPKPVPVVAICWYTIQPAINEKCPAADNNLLLLVRCSYASSWRVIKLIGFNGVDGNLVCPRTPCMATAPSIQPASFRAPNVWSTSARSMLPSVCIFEWKWRMNSVVAHASFLPFQPLYPRLLVQATDRRKGYSCSTLLPRGWLRVLARNVGADAMTSNALLMVV